MPTESIAVSDAGGREMSIERRNFWSCSLEGAIFGGAMSLVSSTTLLPKMIQSYGGPAWLIAAIPILGSFGFLLPPILNAHHVEQLRRFKPFTAWCCLVQRLPYAIAALVLLCLPGRPAVAVAAIALAPLLSGVFGGLGLTAWQQLFTKCVPRERRQAAFGVRSAGASLLGVLAGSVVGWVLHHWPGPTGYGVLHALAFATLMVSFAVFMMTVEPDVEHPIEARKNDLLTHLSSLPAEVFADRDFVLLLGSKFFRAGQFILAPFLALHCQEKLGAPSSFLGQLLVVQMVGSLSANAFAAVLRRSSKDTLIIGLAALAVMAGGALAAATKFQWLSVFFLFGAASSLTDIGSSTLGLEMGRRERRASFLAVAALINLPAMLIASALSYWLHEDFWLLALATLISVLVSIGFVVPLKEPHEKTKEA